MPVDKRSCLSCRLPAGNRPAVPGRSWRNGHSHASIPKMDLVENAQSPSCPMCALLARTLKVHKAYKNNHLFLQRPRFLKHFDIPQVIRQGNTYVDRSLLLSISFPFGDLVFPSGPILYISSSVYLPVKTSLICSSE